MNIKKGLLLMGLSLSAMSIVACGKKEDIKTTTETVKETETVAETVENTAVKESIAAEIKEAMTLEEYIAKVILEENKGMYSAGECQAEAHEILDYKENDTHLKAYTLTMYGEYEFQNDNFVKCSGSGIIPAAIEFEKDGESLKFLEITYPEDGEGYVDSIKNMFPEEYHEICISPTEEIIEKMTKMERYYANEYLKEIDRKAEIGDYADFKYTLLTDEEISVDVSNKMLEYEKEMGPYPMWLGTVEKIEEDVRYVYSKSLDKENKKIIFKKKNYETEEIIESFIYDSETGDKIKN